jgi:hypothetical protein
MYMTAWHNGFRYTPQQWTVRLQRITNQAYPVKD